MWSDVLHILVSIGAGMLGGLITTLLTHRLTASRERQSGISNRRREFLMCLKAWKQTLIGTGSILSQLRDGQNALTGGKPDYSARAEAFRGDLSGARLERFTALDQAILGARMSGEGRKAIDAMIEFVEGH